MELLPLLPQDLPACHALFLASVQALECYSAEQRAAWAPPGPWTPALRAGWEQRLSCAWGCKALADDGRLAGFAWLKFNGEFDMLFVAPWAWRRGVAGRMLQRLEDEAAGQGVTALFAWASHASRPVFERAGYVLLRANAVERNGVTIDNWLMAKGGWREPAGQEEGA